jgi:phosphonate transport system substrate-binding protein
MKRRNFLWYSLLFVAGCTAGTNSPTGGGSSPEALRLAVTDVQGKEDLDRDYGPFKQALEEVLERPIEFFPVDSYTEAVPALQLGLVDLVLTGPSEYVLIRTRTNAVPLTGITRPNYHAAIAVSSKSNIKSLAELKGKTIAMVKVGSTSGHLGPTKLLLEAGLNPKSDYKVEMLGREGSLEALKNGEVDAWGGPWLDYQRLVAALDLESEFPLLKKGPALPNDVFVASSKLNSNLTDEIRSRMVENQKKLIEALAIAPANNKFKTSEMIAADDSDYNMIREVYEALGQGQFFTAE